MLHDCMRTRNSEHTQACAITLHRQGLSRDAKHVPRHRVVQHRYNDVKTQWACEPTRPVEGYGPPVGGFACFYGRL